MTPPQSNLFDYEPDLSVLTDAERDAYEACVMRGESVRAFARRTDRSAGTVGNLLRRARGRIAGKEVSHTW